MASLTDIRAGLAANLAVLNGVQISPYVTSSPTLPVIWIRPAPDEHAEFHQTMHNGLEWWHLIVEAYVGTPSDIGAQMKLDELVESSGPTSVKAAIEADETLGGVAQTLQVERATGYGEYGRPDGTTALGAKWNVLVYMAGG